MAVVFISPKSRQKVFFMGITIILLLFLGSVSLMVFFSKPQEKAQPLVFNKPKVNINLTVLDLEQFKNLQPFTEMEIQFAYNALKDNKPVKGFISAISEDQARETLTRMGFVVTQIKEAEIGRDNPFTPYFDTTINSALNNTTVTKTK